MQRITAIVIARNEEDMIADCIDSVSFCDEVIVIDNNSTDNTAEIAKKMGASVFKYISSDFSDMRNFGMEKAKGDWLFYVDADERVSRELVSSMQYHVASMVDNKIGAFRVRRKNFYFGHYEWPYIEKLERFFKKEALSGWHGKLHESPKFNGKLVELDGFLLHYTHRDLSSMVKKTIEWSKTEAQLRFEANHPPMTWWRFPRVMISAFWNSYIAQEGWKAGTIGVIESLYQAFSMFITYARLWEMQQGSKKNI